MKKFSPNTMQLLETVEKYISAHRLLIPHERVIIGVSGGGDSMALLHILNALGYKCIVAHCNFHLRGEESDRDETFVRSYCAENSFEFHSVSFDTYACMKEKAVSLEMAARELRYNWFEEISQKHGVSKIAVAHHLDDSVETFLINLVRGTGIKGLTGISPENGKIIRPLLCLTRSELLDYLSENSLSFVEDSSNAEDVYLRNKIRLNIIPLLKEINPSINRTINQTSLHLQAIDAIYRQHISEIIDKVFRNNEIDIQLLMESENPESVLFEILHPYSFNAATIGNVLQSANGLSGKVFFADNYRLVKDRNKFILEEKAGKKAGYFYIDEDTTTINTPVKLVIEQRKKEKDFRPEKNSNKIAVDKSTLTFPLHIRKWKQGDRFIPFGMKGSKKLSDYFSDHKFSLIDKENTWLLCNADDSIIWIIGERADERFKVSGSSVDILEIEVNVNNEIIAATIQKADTLLPQRG
ncbi:tRNA lysidine(34) synthetase TilS [Viscerimonas tarda]